MNKEIFLLGIETSTTNCSVSISKNGKTIAIKEDNNAKYSHAESLHIFIKELLNSENISLDNLSGIIISKGPGSYTGLRIGVSTAKGLCYALDIPLISIDTLESVAYQIKTDQDCYIIPMLDARRMEVYTSVYNGDKELVKNTNALVLDKHSHQYYLEQKTCIFIGNGVAKFQEICNHPNATFKIQQFPSSKELSVIGFEKFKQKQFEDVAYFEPFYLKDFIAIKPKK